MDKVLVTGGAGFIGSHLCDYLIKKNYEVICVDNLITGSEKNVKHLADKSNFSFLKLDVTKEWSEVDKFDYIFHLASPASPVDYQNFPEETAITNSIGTIEMLKQAVKDEAKFLLASTSEVYGDPLEHPQKETYWGNVNSFGPRSCYDESKRFSETMTYIYLNSHHLDARIVRIFNTYGPRMQKDDGRVISNFINEALEGKDLNIDGDGSQTRSFCYVSDMVKGIIKAMFEENTKGEIINLGNPSEYTIKDLAEKVIKLTDSASTLVFSREFRQDDPMRRKPDVSKAKEKLGWEAQVGIDEGLLKTITYYKGQMQ